MNMNPPITVNSNDFETLHELLARLPDDAPDPVPFLRAELDRAEVVEPTKVPPRVVTMNSTVRFMVGTNDQVLERTLVYPGKPNVGVGAISVMTPVGSALLGVTEGDSIEWVRDGDATMVVRVIEVVRQPERDGPVRPSDR